MLLRTTIALDFFVFSTHKLDKFSYFLQLSRQLKRTIHSGRGNKLIVFMYMTASEKRIEK